MYPVNSFVYEICEFQTSKGEGGGEEEEGEGEGKGEGEEEEEEDEEKHIQTVGSTVRHPVRGE